MKISYLLSIVFCVGSTNAKLMEHDLLAAEGMLKLGIHLAENGLPSPETCTLDKVSVRREWATLSGKERIAFTDAVNCLHKLPAKTPASVAPGAKSRYDDLVVTHIQQSLTIHGTGNFLTWHRYFTWTFEQMLRNECGYQGTFPYYDWAHYAEDPKSGPFFDGSASSMSGDGEYISGRNSSCFPWDGITGPCYMHLEPGTGGGCVTSGPFKDFKINMGPLQTMLQIPGGLPKNPQADGLGYNPRCLRRDISLQAANATSDSEVVRLIKNYKDIASFQAEYQGEFAAGRMGVHTGGHYTVGGDAGSDFYNSPADPAFYPHHAMIDRVWWIWQNLDLKNREKALAGSAGGIGDTTARNATLGDPLVMGPFVGYPNVTIGEAMSTIGGPFCYIYA
ncbi:Di-copper centre-containing protein [Macroventuria anomochaeta]|uniref:Di-copper centre-containing protein n=1 Tax=Macroventuria anomochaeta TaxID=301207 RepID=A0ACB6RLT2_9PLEO|nr:Di-copper centre-containing protein [Macroventuria anomochaeta]KAF2621922.1 Di-copper centre-containing protein [Macroventuria anomochaeta]